MEVNQWYTVRDFAGFLSVHPVTIHQSQPHLGSSRLPIPVPEPIRLGRTLRWSGRQILDYQAQLAALSGVTLPAPPLELEPEAVEKKAGRPRNVAAQKGAANAN